MCPGTVKQPIRGIRLVPDLVMERKKGNKKGILIVIIKIPFYRFTNVRHVCIEDFLDSVYDSIHRRSFLFPGSYRKAREQIRLCQFIRFILGHLQPSSSLAFTAAINFSCVTSFDARAARTSSSTVSFVTM